MEKDILYTVIIYRDVKKIEIKKESVIEDSYYKDEDELYKLIVSKTRDCEDANKIEIIYK